MQLKSFVMKTCTPILYFRKSIIDNAFFNRLEAKRRRGYKTRSRNIFPIIGSILVAAATAYSNDISAEAVRDAGNNALHAIVDIIPRRKSLDDEKR